MKELERYRDWHAEFASRPIKISEVDRSSGIGTVVSVCDGHKHRKLITGAYDHLVSISPCDQSCGGWREGKGEGVREIVPNLSEKWFTSNDDVDNWERVKNLM
ncbi:MAG TPA: hypothetical protein PLK06_01305 [bacterium]|nr:hypothetical protein [bacterium]